MNYEERNIENIKRWKIDEKKRWNVDYDWLIEF